VKRNDIFFTRGRIRPLLHAESLSARDNALLAQQMKDRSFDPSAVQAVARRCSKGFPSVVRCAPFKGGMPFPTSFWLTCPYLVRLCGERESEGAVGILENAMKNNAREWTVFHLHAARMRILDLPPSQAKFLCRYRKRTWRSLARGGAGGIEYRRRGGGAKCLHLQVAYWLALGVHPARAVLERMMYPLECDVPSKWGCIHPL